MDDRGKTYIQDPDLSKVLAGTGETLFQFVCRHTELVKARESELGTYPGDGPTSEQVDSLLATLRPVFENPGPHAPAVVLHAFQAAVQVEMSWLFPERDPIGFPMTAALRELQNLTGTVLEQAQPEMAPGLDKYADLAVANNALKRQTKLHGNSVIWRVSFTCRMALARFLWWLGSGKKR
jgi:hypothetical protein